MATLPPQGPAMRTVHYVIDWIQDRLRERTSWDGLTIILISVMALAASPLIKYAAWAGVVYGAWTLWKGEGKKPAVPPGSGQMQPE
ncbi:MAG: hypothetical protein MUF20_00630 [Methylotetracoccus sp.]|nr:hypothetical protein [Methylotetracoccus sp.]